MFEELFIYLGTILFDLVKCKRKTRNGSKKKGIFRPPSLYRIVGTNQFQEFPVLNVEHVETGHHITKVGRSLQKRRDAKQEHPPCSKLSSMVWGNDQAEAAEFAGYLITKDTLSA